jgi:hypothetical protein
MLIFVAPSFVSSSINLYFLDVSWLYTSKETHSSHRSHPLRRTSSLHELVLAQLEGGYIHIQFLVVIFLGDSINRQGRPRILSSA